MRTMLNLLPPSYRRQQIVRRRAIQWGSIIGVVLASAWAWHWYERREHVALAQQFEALEREHAPTQAMLKQLVNMRLKLEELQQQEAVASELEHQRSALALLGVISNTTRATNGRLRVTKLELTGFQDVRRSEGPGVQAASNSGLVISGVSLDNPAVSELLDGLHDSGIFSVVELKLLKEREDNDALLRDYQVRCEF